MTRKISVLALLFAMSVVGAIAQTAQNATNAQLRTLAAGQKYKIKGVVVSKENDTTFIVRDAVGVDTKVVVAPNASIKNNSFWGGDKFQSTSIIRGLNLDLEGVGDSTGSLSANKVRFDKANLLTAQ